MVHALDIERAFIFVGGVPCGCQAVSYALGS